jgi:hypothetical protein
MLCPPSGDNYNDECGNDLKPATVCGYNRHMVYGDEYDCMHNKEGIFKPLDYSEEFHSTYLLWFKIITLLFHTGISQGPNTRGGSHATGKTTPSTSQPNTFDLQDSKHCPLVWVGGGRGERERREGEREREGERKKFSVTHVPQK